MFATPNTRPEPPDKALLYARVSSVEQHQEGYSIEAQRDLLRAYARTHSIRVDQEFVDVETAGKAGRTAFNAMLAHSRASGIQAILVEKTDRLYRNIRDWVTLDELDLEIHLVKESTVLSAESRSHEKFIHGIKVLVAKNYIDNLSEEVRKGMIQKVLQGIWPSRAPLGYVNVRGPDGKNVIVVDPERGELVSALLTRYTEPGVTIRRLVQLANDWNLRSRKGRPLCRAGVHYMLRNPLYMGVVRWKDMEVPGMHAPLVAPDVWHAIQVKLGGPPQGRSGRRVYAFTGLLRCATCDDVGRVRLLTGETKKGKYTYYSCSACREEKRSTYFREPDIEERMLHHLRARAAKVELPLDDELVRKVAVQREESRHMLGRARLDVERRRRVAYEDRLAGRLDVGLFTELDAGWRAEIERIDAEIVALGKPRRPAKPVKASASVAELWERSDPWARQQLLARIVRQVRVGVDEFIVSWQR